MERCVTWSRDCSLLNDRLEVNWPRSADIAIEEATKLDQLGIVIPPLARTAALMRQELKQSHESVTALVTRYHQVPLSHLQGLSSPFDTAWQGLGRNLAGLHTRSSVDALVRMGTLRGRKHIGIMMHVNCDHGSGVLLAQVGLYKYF